MRAYKKAHVTTFHRIVSFCANVVVSFLLHQHTKNDQHRPILIMYLIWKSIHFSLLYNPILLHVCNIVHNEVHLTKVGR